mgnify:CR=1 FL=1
MEVAVGDAINHSQSIEMRALFVGDVKKADAVLCVCVCTSCVPRSALVVSEDCTCAKLFPVLLHSSIRDMYAHCSQVSTGSMCSGPWVVRVGARCEAGCIE